MLMLVYGDQLSKRFVLKNIILFNLLCCYVLLSVLLSITIASKLKRTLMHMKKLCANYVEKSTP